MTDTAERRDGSAKLKKNVSKLAFRSREKMLRTFGVGEETKDEIIDNYVHLVTRQQAQFHKFQRDVKLYLQSIIATKNAADCFYSSLNDIYDDDWSGKDMIASLAKTTDLLYSDLHAKLHAEVISLIQNHLTQCNEMKVKVQKRGRKLVDFDAARRSLQMLENSKKPEEAKLSKARDQVTHAHETYETMNTQLHQELPDLHDSRVVLSTDIIRNIASSEKSFYTDLAELRAKLLVVLANLRDAYDGGEYRIQRLHSSVLPKTQIPTSAASSATGTRLQAMGDGPRGSRSNTSASTHSFNKSESRENRELPPEPDQSNHPNDRSQRTSNYVNIDIARPPPVAKQDASVQQLNGQYSDEQNVYDTAEGSESVGDDDQGVYELPPSSGDTPPRHEFVGKADAITNSGDASAVGTKEILPPHFLYKAEALYPYQGSDDDELSFAKGDIIYVVEFPDPEEQDEGWQMGILRSSWEDTGATSGMAVFPENFTRKL